jgi:hypothetical protein
MPRSVVGRLETGRADVSDGVQRQEKMDVLGVFNNPTRRFCCAHFPHRHFSPLFS